MHVGSGVDMFSEGPMRDCPSKLLARGLKGVEEWENPETLGDALPLAKSTRTTCRKMT